MIRTRTRFFTAFLIGAFMMTLGYIFRLISARSPDSLVSYICQSMFIILPPSLYAATIYMTYGRIVNFVGQPHLSIVAPHKVSKIFISGDSAAFLLQLGGGGMQTTNSMRNIGQKVLVIGLIVQLIFFGFFLYVSVAFQRRLRKANLNIIGGPWRRLLHILFLVSALVIGRCVFRIIEYVGGTDGYVYSHEFFMYIFDTVPMFFVQSIFHFVHPGKILVDDSPPVNKLHLELFHHFVTDILTFLGLDKFSPEGSAIDMTKYILSAPFLMNQILAFAALHLSIVHPARQEFYRYHSSQLQTHALSEFNGAKLEVSAETCVPMFLFSSCLAMHVLTEKLLSRPDSFQTFLDDFIQSLRMHRGVRAVTSQSWHLLLQSPLRPLLQNEEMMLDQSTSGNECLELLAHVDTMFDPAISSIYRQTVEDLQKAYNASRSPLSNFSRIGPIISWPVIISPDYIELLSERRPEALAILSHFGALLHMHNEMWTFGHSGLYLISSISHCLGPEWKSWLRWPNTFIQDK
ncbi:Protoporphyrin uptake protein 1 [Talaromyces islandicus]|uniref:Protoporphyrin uptake protein 1 n=1 Tax=Talaromyces islandicus TaxID=28573 RepID=A0A0U1LSQ9_TALIS|nr:Protoporphyrin uptake protein 1 [Talaromyces islandicus]